MIKIPIVKNCPHSRKSSGVVKLPPELVSALAGAVYDKDEWAIILTGTRSDDWFEVNVTGWRLPAQDRTGGNVWIDFEKDVLNEDDLVVVHSHAAYTARFSHTDKEKLNPRFPVSIVVAQKSKSYLGFEYEAVGKVILPCGARAEVEFFIQPTVGPEIAKVERVVHKAEDLGDCNKVENKSESPWHVQYAALCGVHTMPEQLRAHAFETNEDVLNVVKDLPRVKPINRMTETEIRCHKDSHWCQQHNTWDFCKVNQEFLSKNKSNSKGKLKKSRGKGTGSVVSSSTKEERIEPAYYCKPCRDAGKNGDLTIKFTLFVGGATPYMHCKGCDKNYEYAIGDVKPKLESEEDDDDNTDQGVYCWECCKWNMFRYLMCEDCFAPYCAACDIGHEGECYAGDQKVTDIKSKGQKQPDGSIIVM